METLECKCKHCQQPLARFINLWTRLGQNYFSPVLDAIGEVQITTRDAMRVGKPHTLVAEWYHSPPPARLDDDANVAGAQRNPGYCLYRLQSSDRSEMP